MASRTGEGLRLRLRRSSIVLRIKLIILVNSELVIVKKLVDVISFFLVTIMLPEVEVRVSKLRANKSNVNNMTPDLRR
jgi:hypothetical protein